jgi:hypothetical protein
MKHLRVLILLATFCAAVAALGPESNRHACSQAGSSSPAGASFTRTSRDLRFTGGTPGKHL